MKRKIINILGNIILIVCIGYLINAIYKQQIEWGKYIGDWKVIAGIVVSLIILVGSIFFNAHIYGEILNKICKKNIDVNELRDVYITSNIGKYLPGNIMHFVGRNMIGIKYKIEQKKIVIATFSELLLIVTVSFLYVLVFGNKYIYTTLFFIIDKYRNMLGLFQIGIIVISIAAIVLITLYRKRIVNIIKKIDYGFLAKIFIKEIGIFGLASITYAIVLLSIDNSNINYNQIVMLFIVYIIAWLVGFLLPGVPGGIGVREAILTLLLSSLIQRDIILISVVIHRCVTIIADFIAFLLLKVTSKIRRNNR